MHSTHTQSEIFSWKQKINPVWWFMNDTEKFPPDWYFPELSLWQRKVWWLLRNPLTNFTWYVIGIGDKPFTSYGLQPEHVFNQNGGWNWAFRCYKWLRLPFISYKGKYIEWYFGWRERGAFGIALRSYTGKA